MPHQGYQILAGHEGVEPYPEGGRQHWIRRQVGSSVAMIDSYYGDAGAKTTNVYVHGDTDNQPGTAGIAGTGTWAFDANDCDAISFNVSSDYASTYQITHMGCGGVTTDLVGAINPQAMYFDIIAGTTTGGTSLYHLTKPSWNVFLRGYNAANTGASGAQAYPLTGTLPDLDVDTDYTAVWGHGGSQGFSVYHGQSFQNRTVNTGGGSVTMTFSNVTNFNGSGYLGTDAGTSTSAGSLLIFGIKI